MSRLIPDLIARSNSISFRKTARACSASSRLIVNSTMASYFETPERFGTRSFSPMWSSVLSFYSIAGKRLREVRLIIVDTPHFRAELSCAKAPGVDTGTPELLHLHFFSYALTFCESPDEAGRSSAIVPHSPLFIGGAIADWCCFWSETVLILVMVDVGKNLFLLFSPDNSELLPPSIWSQRGKKERKKR